MATTGIAGHGHRHAVGLGQRDGEHPVRGTTCGSSRDAPGVRRGADGPMASGELFVIVDLPKRSSNTTANVALRGVSAAAFEVRPNVQHRPGAGVPERPQRAHRRPRRGGAVRRRRTREDDPLGPERVDRRRHLRRRRDDVGLRDLVRRQRAAAGVPARDVVSDRLREARVGRGVHEVQGRAHDRPAPQPEGAARDRLLRRAVADDLDARSPRSGRSSRS